MPCGRFVRSAYANGPDTYSRADNLGAHVKITDGLQADEDFLLRPLTLRGCERKQPAITQKGTYLFSPSFILDKRPHVNCDKLIDSVHGQLQHLFRVRGYV